LRALAADLVAHQVAVIFAGGLDVDIRAVRAAVTTTPIVLATGGDPVELGLVASFNRPGGNATAVTVSTAALWPKRLELIRELVPSATAVGLLVHPDDENVTSTTRDVQVAARTFGLQVRVVQATTERGIDTAFATLASERADALLVTQNALFNSQREKLVALAAHHTLPAIYDRREFPAAGGLMSYGASNVEQYQQSGAYVGRILKGAKPAELPVLQPTKFELVLNRKTAKALGLTISPTLLAIADEVIE
jgi:putative ABC transport system substrate-binding protein